MTKYMYKETQSRICIKCHNRPTLYGLKLKEMAEIFAPENFENKENQLTLCQREHFSISKETLEEPSFQKCLSVVVFELKRR